MPYTPAVMAPASTDPDALYQRSLEEVQRGDFTRAAELMRAAIDLRPEQARYHCSLARIACQQSDYETAARAFDQAVAVAEADMDEHDHYDHGAVLAMVERHEHAVNAYRRALARTPEWPLLLDNLGVSLQHLGRLDEAEAVLQRALTVHPPDSQAFTLRNLGALVCQMGRPDDAIDCYRQALELEPDNPQTHRDLAAVYHSQEQLEAAETCYRRAVALAPAWVDASRHLADLLVSAKRPDEAEPLYRQLAQTNPGDADVLNGLGTCLNAMERFDEAIDWLRQAVAVAPDEALYHYNLGVVLERARRTDLAVDAYRSAVERDPGMISAHSSLAAALYRLGHLDQARSAYEVLLTLAPEDQVAQHLLAAITGQPSTGAPAAYVIRVFDDYAERYDEHMVATLAYQGPALLSAMAVRVLEPPADGLSVLDLGCGTGMMAEALRDVTRVIHGVDLSQGMLEQARARACYAELWTDDIVNMLGDSDRGLASYDLIVAADVLCYLGDLDPFMDAVRARLAPGGVLLLSVEECPDPGYVLRTTGRYAHSRAYLEDIARRHQLTVRALERAPVRTERDTPVHGIVCALSHAAP